MSNLPDIKWTPLFVPNPDRRWWQLWKRRTILNPDLPPTFFENDLLVDGMIWREVDTLR